MHRGENCMNSNKTTQEMVLTALGMAIVFIATMMIKVPNGLQGYVNLGDGFILLFSSFVRPPYAFLIGGLGSAFADIAGGYGYYFLFTLLIKGIEAFLVSKLISSDSKKSMQYIAYSLGSILMITGYVIADTFVNQSLILALASVPGNCIQAILGIGISVLGYPIVRKWLPPIFTRI